MCKCSRQRHGALVCFMSVVCPCSMDKERGDTPLGCRTGLMLSLTSQEIKAKGIFSVVYFILKPAPLLGS